MKTPFRREHTGAASADRMQRGAQDLSRRLRLCPFLEGRAVSAAFPPAVGGLGATPTSIVINHGLGAPAAFFAIRPNYDGTGNVVAFAEAADQSGVDLNNALRVTASNTCVADLWFYARTSQTIPSGGTQSP